MSSYALSEIAEIIDCEHKTAPTVEVSQYRSIRTTDIAGGKINIDKANRVSEDTFLDGARELSQSPVILFWQGKLLLVRLVDSRRI